jgi:hypothetical protein
MPKKSTVHKRSKRSGRKSHRCKRSVARKRSKRSGRKRSAKRTGRKRSVARKRSKLSGRKRSAKRTGRKTSGRKTSGRKTSRRKTSGRKTSGRKTSGRKTSRRKTSRRKTSGRKTSRRKRSVKQTDAGKRSKRSVKQTDAGKRSKLSKRSAKQTDAGKRSKQKNTIVDDLDKFLKKKSKIKKKSENTQPNIRKNTTKTGSRLDNINFVIHETTIKGLEMIMKSQKLLTNKSRKELGLCMKGQGCYKRRLGPSDASLENKNFYNIYDEAYGSYFRIDFDDSLKNHESYDYKMEFGDVCLVFSKELLNKDNWILNTTENYGFYLNLPGMIGESSYTGYEGITYDSSNIDRFPSKDIGIFKNDTEFVIKDDIDLSCLVKVIFRNKSDYEKYKHLVPKKIEVI